MSCRLLTKSRNNKVNENHKTLTLRWLPKFNIRFLTHGSNRSIYSKKNGKKKYVLFEDRFEENTILTSRRQSMKRLFSQYSKIYPKCATIISNSEMPSLPGISCLTSIKFFLLQRFHLTKLLSFKLIAINQFNLQISSQGDKCK